MKAPPPPGLTWLLRAPLLTPPCSMGVVSSEMERLAKRIAELGVEVATIDKAISENQVRRRLAHGGQPPYRLTWNGEEGGLCRIDGSRAPQREATSRLGDATRARSSVVTPPLQPPFDEATKRIEMRAGKLASLKASVNSIADTVFGAFCAKMGLESIRSYEVAVSHGGRLLAGCGPGEHGEFMCGCARCSCCL